MSKTRRTWSIVSLAVAITGCGSTGSSIFDGGGGDVGGRGHHGDADDSGSDAPRLLLEGGGAEGGVDAAACASDHAAAMPSPAYLVFIMDHSDSMKADSKWTSCSTALEAFFRSKKTTALSASLTWLPFVASAPKSKASCDATDYETPAIPMTALPSSLFATAIKAEPLQAGTPTLAALQGTVTYAMKEQKAHPKDKVVIVLATDGIPAGCKTMGNDVANVASEAMAAFTAGIFTYVIGVGSQLTNLDTIASAGGTKTAFLVSTTDPATTVKDFEKAIAQIQTSLGCAYDIPNPPGGQTIDYAKVNVEIVRTGGKTTELAYSATCSNPDGWHYDDPKAPTRIILCSAACSEAETAAEVNIVFGCRTNGVK